MAKTVSIDQAAAAIVDILADYRDAVNVDVEAISDKLGKAAAKKVKEKAPVRSGAYKKSIVSKKVKGGKSYYGRVVYSKAPYYRMAHLLEFGHATLSGGRTKAIPHWSPTEREVVAEFEKELKEAIENGS